MLASHNRGVCYAQYTQHYHDQLCKDLNQSPKRKVMPACSSCASMCVRLVLSPVATQSNYLEPPGGHPHRLRAKIA